MSAVLQCCHVARLLVGVDELCVRNGRRVEIRRCRPRKPRHAEVHLRARLGWLTVHGRRGDGPSSEPSTSCGGGEVPRGRDASVGVQSSFRAYARFNPYNLGVQRKSRCVDSMSHAVTVRYGRCTRPRPVRDLAWASVNTKSTVTTGPSPDRIDDDCGFVTGDGIGKCFRAPTFSALIRPVGAVPHLAVCESNTASYVNRSTRASRSGCVGTVRERSS